MVVHRCALITTDVASTPQFVLIAGLVHDNAFPLTRPDTASDPVHVVVTIALNVKVPKKVFDVTAPETLPLVRGWPLADQVPETPVSVCTRVIVNGSLPRPPPLLAWNWNVPDHLPVRSTVPGDVGTAGEFGPLPPPQAEVTARARAIRIRLDMKMDDARTDRSTQRRGCDSGEYCNA
jgi:hypothetical protein